MLPLAMSAAPLEGFENNKSILNSRKNKTIKKEPFENKHTSSIENLENSINKIKTIHNSEDDSPELANFVKEYQHANYDSNVSYAFSCLNEDPQYKNPFNPSDNEGAFWQNWDVPTVQQIGRTACNYRSDKDRIDCNSRWGTGANDYETTIIPRM